MPSRCMAAHRTWGPVLIVCVEAASASRAWWRGATSRARRPANTASGGPAVFLRHRVPRFASRCVHRGEVDVIGLLVTSRVPRFASRRVHYGPGRRLGLGSWPRLGRLSVSRRASAGPLARLGSSPRLSVPLAGSRRDRQIGTTLPGFGSWPRLGASRCSHAAHRCLVQVAVVTSRSARRNRASDTRFSVPLQVAVVTVLHEEI
jgi:hypothetical protein